MISTVLRTGCIVAPDDVRLDFLLCSERSGSNLLTRMLDSHPLVSGPPPSHLVRTFSENVARYGDLTCPEAWRTLAGDVADLLENQLGTWATTPSAKEIVEGVSERSLAAIVRHVYREEAEAAGKPQAFVKENRAHAFLP